MQQHYHGPISAKGIVFEDGAVWLRRNERNEWELPGGKIDQGEQPENTVARELQEELGFEVDVVRLIDAFVYKIPVSAGVSRDVLVISYLCELLGKTGLFEIEGEAGPAEFKKFQLEEISTVNMPRFYKRAIDRARQEFQHLIEKP